MKDQVKPSRILTSYIYFATEQIPLLKERDGVKHQDAMKRVGEVWGSLTEVEKAPYIKKSKDDEKRYHA